MSFIEKILGDPDKKYLKSKEKILREVDLLEEKFAKLGDEEIKKTVDDLREEVQKGVESEKVLPRAFALVREAAKRTLGQRHFPVQILGGITLHEGNIAEMKTGEGKTLASTLAVFLNLLGGRGVHIVTVNDYLAKRDAVWMGQIYYALGASVACITHNSSFIYDPEFLSEKDDRERDRTGYFKVKEDYLKPCERKEAYGADITYGTNNEFGFDFLRDNLVYRKEDKVQRGFNYAIVDEIDSVLIDEARTPLIISRPEDESSSMYRDFSRIIPQLKENSDYNVDEKLKAATLTEEGVKKVENILGLDNIYEERGIKYLHYLEQSLRAHTLFQKDRDYVVRNGQIVIVDEFTGRLMPGRRWSGGLHQAIEAKEGVNINPESKTLASITFQNFFRKYKKLAGMTGTAKTAEEEFQKVYGMNVVAIPTNKPLIRKDMSDKIFKTEMGKFKALVKETKEKNEKGQPVLIGTSSIEKNEILDKMLRREGINTAVLNAKKHEKEGQIIAQAGKVGTVTVATNMAGRGVDIVLGGSPYNKEEAEKVKNKGGLAVLGAQRHEARRIDNQLRGRAGRQGDPGSSQFFISLEDKILRVFGGDRIKMIAETFKMPEDQPIEVKILSGAIEKAQKRVEGFNFDARSHTLSYDEVLSKHRDKIYSWRNKILETGAEEIKNETLNILEEEVESIVFNHKKDDNFNYEEIFEEMKTIVSLPDGVHYGMRALKDEDKIKEYLFGFVKRNFEMKMEEEGEERREKILRWVFLKSIDTYWLDHLDTMAHLKDSVGLRAYGGKDPLVEYKTEGHRIFRGLESKIKSQIARTIFKVSLN